MISFLFWQVALDTQLTCDAVHIKLLTFTPSQSSLDWNRLHSRSERSHNSHNEACNFRIVMHVVRSALHHDSASTGVERFVSSEVLQARAEYFFKGNTENANVSSSHLTHIATLACQRSMLSDYRFSSAARLYPPLAHRVHPLECVKMLHMLYLKWKVKRRRKIEKNGGYNHKEIKVWDETIATYLRKGSVAFASLSPLFGSSPTERRSEWEKIKSEPCSWRQGISKHLFQSR